MNPPIMPTISSHLPAQLCQQLWESDAATQLLSQLDERYAAVRAAARASESGRPAALSLVENAELGLSEARAVFVEFVCELHRAHAMETGLLDPRDQTFDALSTLWDFEAAWENALLREHKIDEDVS